MKHLVTYISVLTCVTILVVCHGNCFAADQGKEKIQASKEEDDPLRELRQLAEADPVKDFQAAKARNDIHFIGVKGVTIIVPGVDKAGRYYKLVETRVVKGTGDVPTSEEQIPLTRKVLVYAEKYNKLVIQLLTEKSPER